MGTYKKTHILILPFLTLCGAAKLLINPEPAPVSDATAVAGGVAKLPCDLTPISTVNGDKAHLVIWYKEGNILPIYSFDVREKPQEQARHWSDAASLGGRAYFRSEEKPAILTLEGVKDSDGGVYRCRVDFKSSPTRNTRVNLTVIIPPERLNVLDERGDSIQQYILGPYNEGSAVDIACIAVGGRPPPRVTWWQENALLDDSWELLPDRRVRNLLRLERLERRHLHAVFTCQASNNNLVPPISSAITLDLNLRPLWVKLLGDNRPLSAEQTQELSCEAIGARPPPVITWWKGSLPLRNTIEETSPDGNRTVSTVRFVPTMEDFGKFLSCRADTPLIHDSALEDGWKLNVYHVPVVTLELGGSLNASSIKEGVDVYFECNIKSNPWVYRVSWRHNGKTLINNASAGVFVSNQSLVLQQVTRESAGLYTCVASNREGDGESNPLFLDIKYAPLCHDSQPRVIGAAKGEVTRIPCEVEANPNDVEFIWKVNSTIGDLSELPTAQYTTEKARSVAAYTPVTEQDFGTLLCWASNNQGQQRDPCIFQLTPAGKPDSLSNCSIVNQTADTLRVECVEGFDGGLVQEFVMEVYDAQTQSLVGNVSSPVPSFTIASLRPGLGFDIALYAANGKGHSRITVLHAYTLKSAERRIETPIIVHLTPLLGALIGVVVSLVLVLLAVLLALRLRGRNYEDKNSNDVVKGSSESADSLDKNPDIIPHNNDYQDADEKAFEKLNNQQQSYVSHISAADKPRGEVTYAELSLPSSVYATLIRKPPPKCQETIYSQIDPALCLATAETPLISHTRESAVVVDPAAVRVVQQSQQTQVVTATRF
ncbi:nephrin-like isoform X2 [Lycorma delicatula]|uniref:nephrin-like isoform X2 n=1 Tax=Lycorma delicatula TaxID=130591 RepID=UPI003F512DD4